MASIHLQEPQRGCGTRGLSARGLGGAPRPGLSGSRWEAQSKVSGMMMEGEGQQQWVGCEGTKGAGSICEARGDRA